MPRALRTRIEQVLGGLLIGYLRKVWLTNRISFEPVDAAERLRLLAPCIIVTWHGQNFLAPFIAKPPIKYHTLIARGMFGNIYAHAVQSLGLSVVRGSSGSSGQVKQKGGAVAFRQMLRALKAGDTIALTADVESTPRMIGRGVVRLAQVSGSPILPLAVVTSFRFALTPRWDKPAVSLPWGRIAVVLGDPIYVLPGEALQEVQHDVRKALNVVGERATAILCR